MNHTVVGTLRTRLTEAGEAHNQLANLAKNIAKRWLASLLLLVTLIGVASLLYGVVSIGFVSGNNVDRSESDLAGEKPASYFSIEYRYDPESITGLAQTSVADKVLIVGFPVLCLVLPALTPLIAVLVVPAIALLILITIQLRVGLTIEMFEVLVILGSILLAYLIGCLLMWSRTRRKVDLFFRQYVPSQLSNHYMRNPDEIGMGGELREITIMFCDIKRFTAISETLDPDLLPQWLNRFFHIVSEIIVKRNGTIDKFMGDSVMAIWGAPGHDDNHASNGLLAAMDILEAVNILSKEFTEAGCPALEVGIGVSTGKAHVGHLGSPHRITYTAVGDAVNMADRLEKCTGFYDLPLIVNDATMEAVGDFLFRELDTVHVKGRQRFIRIYQPVCHQTNASPDLHRQLQRHRKAMQFYRRGMWKDAELLFRKLSVDSGERDFYNMYIDRLIDIRQSQQANGGTHVVDFTQKMG